MIFANILNDYKNRLSTTGKTLKEQYIDSFLDSFTDGFDDNLDYDVATYKKRNDSETISNVGIHILNIKYDSEKIGLDKFKKVIFEDSSFIPGCGDTISFNGANWLVIQIDTIGIMKSCIIGKCDNVINVVTNNNTQYIYPILINALNRLDIINGNYLLEPNTKKTFFITNDDITANNVKRNRIYSIGLDNYKVIDVDDISNFGVLVVTVGHSQEEQQLPDENEPIFEYKIIGDDEIYVGQTKTYLAVKYIEDLGENSEDNEVEFEFSIIGDIPTNKYKLTIIDNQTCTIEAKDYPYTFALRATDLDTNRYTEKQIELVGFF